MLNKYIRCDKRYQDIHKKKFCENPPEEWTYSRRVHSLHGLCFNQYKSWDGVFSNGDHF